MFFYTNKTLATSLTKGPDAQSCGSEDTKGPKTSGRRSEQDDHPWMANVLCFGSGISNMTKKTKNVFFIFFLIKLPVSKIWHIGQKAVSGRLKSK